MNCQHESDRDRLATTAALRLTVAWLDWIENQDRPAFDIAMDVIGAEVDGCEGCWATVAQRAAFLAATYVARHAGVHAARDELHKALAETLDEPERRKDELSERRARRKRHPG